MSAKDITANRGEGRRRKRKLLRPILTGGTESSSNFAAAKDATLGTNQKALQINLDSTKFGAFAEIGAGQEMARWFCPGGGDPGAHPKTIAA